MTKIGLYIPSGSIGSVRNPFGKDTANSDLFKSLAQHGRFSEIGVFSNGRPARSKLLNELFSGVEPNSVFWAESVVRASAIPRLGALLRGLPDLTSLAWQRQRSGDRSYSLIGLIHTLAPPAIREQIASTITAPVQPWDALICTSPAVLHATKNLLSEVSEYIAGRFNGSARPTPYLPLIPLGVDVDSMIDKADRPDVRVRMRDRLNVGEQDVLVMWLGRLSHEEKAFPQPMFKALEEASNETKSRVHFVMAGWFADQAIGRQMFCESAQHYAPNINVRFLDGNNQCDVSDAWAAADVFLSLVDNVQETFGLTVLEAMAAGLPLVVSDWDGYRFTVRDGIEGFLVPTLGGPTGAGQLMSDRHTFGLDTYQQYVGTVAAHTAVDVGRAAKALASLIRDAQMRRDMGAAGRLRVQTHFSWPNIAKQIHELVVELAEIRAKTSRFGEVGPSVNPSRGDPFKDFSGFASSVISLETMISVRFQQMNLPEVSQFVLSNSLKLDRYGEIWRGSDVERIQILRFLGDGVPRTIAEVVDRFPQERQHALVLTIAGLCKLGVLDWTAEKPVRGRQGL